jgi:hypothetical protein
LKAHLLLHMQAPSFTCSITSDGHSCEKEFNSRAPFWIHLKKHHRVTSQSNPNLAIPCPFPKCKSSWPSFVTLAGHAAGWHAKGE